MPYPRSRFPFNVWDGLTENRNRISQNSNLTPDSLDWERIASEVIAIQRRLADLGLVVRSDPQLRSTREAEELMRQTITTGIVSDNYAAGAIYPRVGVRLNPASLGETLNIFKIEIQAQNNNDIYHWKLVRNPAIAPAPPFTALPDSDVEVFIGDDTFLVADEGEILTEGIGIGITPIGDVFFDSVLLKDTDQIYIIFEPANPQRLFVTMKWITL